MFQVRTHQVGGWLKRMEVLEKEVQEILVRGELEMKKSCQGAKGNSQFLRLEPQSTKLLHEISVCQNWIINSISIPYIYKRLAIDK